MNTNQSNAEPIGNLHPIFAEILSCFHNTPPTKSGVPYDKENAHIQIKAIHAQLDALEQRYFFSDAHGHDVSTNEWKAFYALQKAKEAFLELELKF